LSVAERRSTGTSVASSPKTIALTVAAAAAKASTAAASCGTDAANGIKPRAAPPTRSAPGRMRRNPTRSPSAPPSGAMSAPTRDAEPTTRAIELARPGPTPTRRSTSTGTYGRVVWFDRKAIPKIAKMRRTAGSPRTPRIAP
jgi:hypothetical protein